jgi:hypothetical protein
MKRWRRREKNRTDNRKRSRLNYDLSKFHVQSFKIEAMKFKTVVCKP